MIVDVFTFNGEVDLLELRLNMLDPYVDQFIIVEAPTTFSGLMKPLYFEKYQDRFEKFWDKIIYHIIDEQYTGDEIREAEESPNTIGAKHWVHEFLIKESIKKALIHLDDNDIVIIGDVDEIPDIRLLSQTKFKTYPVKLKLKVYSYYLNNRSDEEFWGPILAPYKDIKGKCLNHLRNNSVERNTTVEYGWHFTSIGGYEEVLRKLTDSYTHETYASPWVIDNLEYNIAERKDFLGRNFTYTLSEEEWPQYLKDNKNKYLHLCKS